MLKWVQILEETIIYKESNPYDSFTAYLEDDGRTVYLYLQSEFNPDITLKSVWVKNRMTPPKERSIHDLEDGLAPILLADEILNPEDITPIKEKEIYLLWTEEGDGVALYHNQELLAFIPSWSGMNGFYGYNKNIKKESITGSPLGNPIIGEIPNRLNKAKLFWETYFKRENWKDFQTRMIYELESIFGGHIKYWSLDGGKFPLVGLIKFKYSERPDISIYCSIGMSYQKMPKIELYLEDFEKLSKIELLFCLSDPDNVSDFWVPHLFGEIVKYPWNIGSWFGNGHTLGLPRMDPNQVFVHFTKLFFNNEIPYFLKNLEEKIQSIPFEPLFLQLITEEEAEFLKLEGASQFIELWKNNNNQSLNIHQSDRKSLI